jgi:hypothetical protein
METKLNKEKLDLIKRIRKQTLFYSIAYLKNQYVVNLRTIAALAEEGIFGGSQ